MTAKADRIRVQDNLLTLVHRSITNAHTEMQNCLSLYETGEDTTEAEAIVAELRSLHDRVLVLKSKANPLLIRNPLSPKEPE